MCLYNEKGFFLYPWLLQNLFVFIDAICFLVENNLHSRETLRMHIIHVQELQSNIKEGESSTSDYHT